MKPCAKSSCLGPNGNLFILKIEFNTNMKNLAVKVSMVIALAVSGALIPAQAGIPVIDSANLTQTVMTAVENVAQTLKQIEQYRTQLQQYENMIQNTVAPAAYIWDQAQSTINGLMNAVNTRLLQEPARQLG